MSEKTVLTELLLRWYLSNGAKYNLSFKENNIPKEIFSEDQEIQKSTKEKKEHKKNEIFKNCKTLDELKNLILEFSDCSLKNTAKSLVFSDGNPKANVMLIGEAPGEEEDKLARPFVGSSGILLDKMLGAIGQNRKNTYLSNVIFWRPPGNRKPTPEEISLCLPFVFKHIELIRPKLLILAGAIAAKALFGSDNTGITQIRGKWKNININNKFDLRSIAIFHPSFLLKQPSRKKEAWEDLKKIKIEIDKNT